MKKKPAASSAAIEDDERRELPRISSTCIVDYRLIDEVPEGIEDPSASGLLQNISGGGAQLTLPTDPGVGQGLAVKIHLPGLPSSVIAFGKVCWSRPRGEQFEIGFEFWWVGWDNALAQEEIRQFISRKLGEPGPVGPHA
jgi:hypothetical protein